MVGAVVVKPTSTQFIEHFLRTLIIGMDESTHLLHLSKFKFRLVRLKLRMSEGLDERANQWLDYFAALCFTTK